MPMQKVNTMQISAIANAISSANSTLDAEFSNVQSAGQNMASNWNSEAGRSAITKMYELFRGNEARSTILENHVNYLQQTVVVNYNSAEQSNNELSDLFL